MRATVAVYEVDRPETQGRYAAHLREMKPPRALPNFAVEGEDHDGMKGEAKAYLEEKGHRVRGVSWGPGVTPRDPERLIAYVYAKE